MGCLVNVVLHIWKLLPELLPATQVTKKVYDLCRLLAGICSDHM